MEVRPALATSNNSADEIRRRMAEIRSKMHHEMSGVVTSAMTAVDWRSYPKSRPWLSLGIAFATGYLVVPRRSKPTVEVQANPVTPRASKPQDSTRQPLFTKLLMGGLAFGGPLLIRAAQGFALREIESFLEGQTRTVPPRQDRPQGPTANTTHIGSYGHKRFQN